MCNFQGHLNFCCVLVVYILWARLIKQLPDSPLLYPARCNVSHRLSCTFHIAVRLFSNRLQMTSKRGKNKNVAHEAIVECFTDDILCDLLPNRRTATWYLYVLYNKETKLLQLFCFKIVHYYSKAVLCSLWRTRKKPVDVICCLYKMKQFH